MFTRGTIWEFDPWPFEWINSLVFTWQFNAQEVRPSWLFPQVVFEQDLAIDV